MNIYIRSSLILIFISTLVSSSVSADYTAHPDAQKFIDQVVSEHKLDRSDVLLILQSANKQQSIIDAMNRPAEKVKTWAEYRKIFIQERRIDQGIKFWLKNHENLTRASKKYNVPPEVIVAIIGVETSYGRNKGSYRVIDALTTLAFDYPKRSAFFTKQLKSFLES